MIRRILTILLICVAASGSAYAEDLRTLFLNMPDSIMPTLTRSDRMDFLDFKDIGMKARATNKLGGESVMTELSERMLSVTTSGSGKVDMVLLPCKNGSNLICIIKTVTARYDDSRLEFYNEDWTPVDAKKLIKLPRFDDYLTREALRQDSLSYFKKLSILRLQSITAVENALEFRYTSLDYIGEDADRYRSWIKSDPIIYTWTGKRFKRK
jgi:hypothetical protein